MHFDFNIEALPAKIIESLRQFASAKLPPPVDPADVWGELVLEIRRRFPTQGFPLDRWKAETSEGLGWLAGKIRETQEGYQNHWWNELLPGIRVFCVSEERDNLLMWAHYAKDHTGAVLEFWSLPEEDNPLAVARPVQYVQEPLAFFSEAEFLEDIFSIKKLDFPDLYRRYVYAKSVHWSYEREWRVWYPLSKTGLYDDMPIRHSEFAALYFGCRAHPDFKTEVLALLRQSFPEVRICQAVKMEKAYAVAYKEI